jgi:hypothetical protein
MRVIDETFKTLDEMIEKYGKILDITRRRCESIRKRSPLAMKKYKHVCIETISPVPITVVAS